MVTTPPPRIRTRASQQLDHQQTDPKQASDSQDAAQQEAKKPAAKESSNAKETGNGTTSPKTMDAAAKPVDPPQPESPTDKTTNDNESDHAPLANKPPAVAPPAAAAAATQDVSSVPSEDEKSHESRESDESYHHKDSDEEEEQLVDHLGNPLPPEEAKAARAKKNKYAMTEVPVSEDPEEDGDKFFDEVLAPVPNTKIIYDKNVNTNAALHWCGITVPEKDAKYQKITVYQLDNGTFFRCSEPTNQYAKDLLARLALKAFQTNLDAANRRTVSDLIPNIVVQECHRLQKDFVQYTAPSSLPARMGSAFARIFNGFAVSDPYAPNFALYRMAYCYAMYRLGKHGYRMEGTETAHAYEAAKHAILLDMGQKSTASGGTMYPVVAAKLLEGHLRHRKLATFDFLPRNAPAQVKKAQKSHSKAYKISEHDFRFHRESRPDVVKQLEKIIADYKKLEKKEMDANGLAETQCFAANDDREYQKYLDSLKTEEQKNKGKKGSTTPGSAKRKSTTNSAEKSKKAKSKATPTRLQM